MHGGDVSYPGTATIFLLNAKLQNALPVFNLEILYAPDRTALQPRLSAREHSLARPESPIAPTFYCQRMPIRLSTAAMLHNHRCAPSAQPPTGRQRH